MAMNGMEMMLKAIGLDKEFIEKNVKGAVDVALSLQAQLNRIEAQNTRIIDLLEKKEHGESITNGSESGSDGIGSVRRLAAG